MRQIFIVLATAVITATVAMAGVLAVNPGTTRPSLVVRTSNPVDVLQMMKDAKDLPEHVIRRSNARLDKVVGVVSRAPQPVN